jgi:hypothetical protein
MDEENRPCQAPKLGTITFQFLQIGFELNTSQCRSAMQKK